MSISIYTSLASPNVAPNEITTPVTVTFMGEASYDNTIIIVRFTVSKYPDFSIDGQQFVEENYELDSAVKTFTKSLSIRNTLKATSGELKIGRITLTARQEGTPNTSKSTATFKNQ